MIQFSTLTEPTKVSLGMASEAGSALRFSILGHSSWPIIWRAMLMAALWPRCLMELRCTVTLRGAKPRESSC